MASLYDPIILVDLKLAIESSWRRPGLRADSR